MQERTVNIIQTNGDNGLVSSLNSFADNKIGNEQAEKLFVEICKESTDLTDDLIDCQLTEGYADIPGGALVQIVHSESL
jgi:hypothetical protein